VSGVTFSAGDELQGYIVKVSGGKAENPVVTVWCKFTS